MCASGQMLRVSCAGRCLLGEADGALYMAFMGTKQRRDLVTNAQVLQEPIWPEDVSPRFPGRITGSPAHLQSALTLGLEQPLSRIS